MNAQDCKMAPRNYDVPKMSPDMVKGGKAPRGMVADGGPRNVPTVKVPADVQARADRYEAQNLAEATAARHASYRAAGLLPA